MKSDTESRIESYFCEIKISIKMALFL